MGILKLITGTSISTYLNMVMAISLATNVALGYLYKESLQDTARVELQGQLHKVLEANARAETVRVATKAGYEAQVTELLRHLELSDSVAEEARLRAGEAAESLAGFEEAQGAREAASLEYKSWSRVPLPANIATGLQSLAEGPLQVEED